MTDKMNKNRNDHELGPTIMGVPVPIMGRVSDEQQTLISLQYELKRWGHKGCLKDLLEYLKTNQTCPVCKTKTETDKTIDRWNERGRTSPLPGYPKGRTCVGGYYM
jgi:hypothetical protein